MPERRKIIRWGLRQKTQDDPTLLALLASHLPDGEVPAAYYPWCFVISAGFAGYKNPLAGAVIRHSGQSYSVLYSEMPVSWLCESLRHSGSFMFWLARLLVGRTKMSTRKLNSVIRLLEKHFSVSMHVEQQQSLLHSRCALLLTDCCEMDYAVSKRSGVELIPWVAWPECINHGAHLWLWQQSRYGRILDARRIPQIHV